MKIKLIIITVLTLLGIGHSSIAQRPNILQGITSRIPTGTGSSGGSDSLRSRALAEENVTIRFNYLDTFRNYQFDSSLIDFTVRYPLPSTFINLGNTGSAARSILFAPAPKAGWDPGFHAFDIYKLKLEQARFYNTTRPYTQIGYLLASGGEQIIDLLHTQNIKPYWNFSFNYRLIAAPGTFRNQKSNHNNIQLTSWYQSPNRRYNNYVVLQTNKIKAGENGGIRNGADLNDPAYAASRFTVPTFLGGDPVQINTRNVFDASIYTGNRYTETNYFLRQQYDFGRKDSIVTDSTVVPLFFPKLRFEHSLTYGKYRYIFQDLATAGTQRNTPDSAYYKDRYDLTIDPSGDSIILQDRWREIKNDFSIYQFPDSKNLQQFIRIGAELQLLRGTFRNEQNLHNVMLHGEYRNRTKSQKWDILAYGRLWVTGYNNGDYHAYINLQRLINPKVGSLQLGFENISRTPPFIYNPASNFYLDVAKSFKKENTVHLFGSILQPKLNIRLSADYYLITNYLYLTNYYRLQQEATVFNVLRINAQKTFRIGKRWNWHANLYIQQKAGDAEVNFPTLYTRNLFGYEGKLGFKRLQIAFGTEVRYHTPYKADGYSPLLGQFFYQDSVTLSNRPQVDLYMHFRIRNFTAYLRGENLNTIDLQGGGFTANNYSAPGYPTPGLVIRFGIFWSFVN